MANTPSVSKRIRGLIGNYMLMFVTVATLIFTNESAAAAGKINSNSSELDGGWFLESNMVNLDPSNRHLGSLVATNPGKGPIYLRVTVNRLQLVDGVRKVSPDPDGALKAFPQEFVLRPGESFPVRLLVDLSKQQAPSQSYYVNVADVSDLKPNFQALKSGLVNGFVLAYDALVSVQANPIETLTERHFAFNRGANGQFSLENLSGQHIYLNRGDACPDATTVLVNCSPVEKFPRQTMLPGETLSFPAFTAPVLGMLAYPKLNTRSRATLLYLKAPEAK